MQMLQIRKKESGFTLIEMAIVLVVIGLIVAALTVGKDTMRTAEYNKVYSKYVNPWIQAAYTYFAKTGVVPTSTHGFSACNDNATCVAAMKTVGVSLPDSYQYTDESGTTVSVAVEKIVDSRILAVQDADAGTARRGGMVIYFYATEAIAKMVDTILDSGADVTTNNTGLGNDIGDVRWGTPTTYTTGGQNAAAPVITPTAITGIVGGVYMSIRLRDITGTGPTGT
jgi:prepilin-type N-terminal cleavage/methylation domain-containing protein